MQTNRVIAWLTGMLTLLLALFSFILSFNALMDLADTHGVAIPALFPLMVEAGVVIFSLNALYRSLAGESARVQWGLIIGSSLLSGMFNIAHAEESFLSRAMAAMPSLFLILSFETFLGQIKYAVKRSTTIKSFEQLTHELDAKRRELDSLIEQKTADLDEVVQAKQLEIEQLNSRAEKLRIWIEQYQTTIEQLKTESKQTKSVQSSSIEQVRPVQLERVTVTIEHRRSEILNLLTVEGDIGVSALAERLNTSRNTVYSDLKALSEAGQIVKNGNGWEIVQ